MPARRMTPHKGGRTEVLTIRVTPRVKEAAFRIAKSQGITVSDLINDYIISLLPVYRNTNVFDDKNHQGFG